MSNGTTVSSAAAAAATASARSAGARVPAVPLAWPLGIGEF
jgi:hypothetical protein